MNLLQQCKAMLTPHGQIQMSYDRFKNTFGDLGVAKWRAFLMDNNNLPDGTYNGITKVTINKLPANHNTMDAKGRFAFSFSLNKYKSFIPPSSNDDVWQYGFTNWNLLYVNKTWSENATCCGMTTNGYMYIKVYPQLSSEDEFNAYLAKHPLVLYYYDSSVYSGAIVTADKMYVTSCFYTHDATDATMPVGTNTDMHDVLGKYHWYGNVGYTSSYKAYDADLMIGAGVGSGESTYHRVNFKNNAYTLDETGLTQFKANELPRAIVWKG